MRFFQSFSYVSIKIESRSNMNKIDTATNMIFNEDMSTDIFVVKRRFSNNLKLFK